MAVALCSECGDRVCPQCRQIDADGLAVCPMCRPLLFESAKPDTPPPSVDEGPVPTSVIVDEVSDTSRVDSPDLEHRIPWEQGGGVGASVALWRMLRMAISGPFAYMARVPQHRAGLMTPFLFAVLCGTVGRACSLLYQPLDGFQGNEPAAVYMGTLLGVPQSVALLLIMPLLPMVIAFSVFLQSAIGHGVLSLSGATYGGFEATFRVFAYSSVASLLLVVPVIGTVVEPFLVVILQLTGLRVTHRASFARTLLAILPLFFLRIVGLSIVANAV